MKTKVYKFTEQEVEVLRNACEDLWQTWGRKVCDGKHSERAIDLSITLDSLKEQFQADFRLWKRR